MFELLFRDFIARSLCVNKGPLQVRRVLQIFITSGIRIICCPFPAHLWNKVLSVLFVHHRGLGEDKMGGVGI